MSRWLPAGVRGMAAQGPEWAAWVERLPALREALLADWGLRVDGIAQHGHTALVVPCVDERGTALVLKIAFPDDETLHEHRAMTHWAGRGAARLLRADPARRALLLERLGSRSLRDVPDLEACHVVAGLYAALHLPAFRPLPRLDEWTAGQTERLAALPRSAPVPHRLVTQAVSLGRALADDPATTGTLVHGDLHYDNVLADPRGAPPGEGWRAIDPKPWDGDPHFEPAPMLWNRFDEIGPDVRAGVRRRFHALVDEGGLDEERARDWVVLRMAVNAMWQLVDDGGPRDAGARAWLTTCVAVAKAVQD